MDHLLQLPSELQLHHVYSGLDPLTKRQLFRSFKSPLVRMEKLLLKEVIKVGTVDQIKDYIDTKLWDDKQAVYLACKYNNFPVLKYLVETLHITPTSNDVNAAAGAGNINTLKYLIYNNKIDYSPDIIAFVLQGTYGIDDPNLTNCSDKLDVAKWLYKSFGVLPPIKGIEKLEISQEFWDSKTYHMSCETIATVFDRIDILDWLEEIDSEHNYNELYTSFGIMGNAAKFGYIDILEWLDQKYILYNGENDEDDGPYRYWDQAFEAAIQNKQIEVLEWLRSHKAKPKTNEFVQAIYLNDIDIVKILLACGYSSPDEQDDYDIVDSIALIDNPDIEKLVFNSKVLDSIRFETIVSFAVHREAVNLLSYLYEQGYPISEANIRAAIQNYESSQGERHQIYDWLVKNGLLP